PRRRLPRLWLGRGSERPRSSPWPRPGSRVGPGSPRLPPSHSPHPARRALEPRAGKATSPEPTNPLGSILCPRSHKQRSRCSRPGVGHRDLSWLEDDPLRAGNGRAQALRLLVLRTWLGSPSSGVFRVPVFSQPMALFRVYPPLIQVDVLRAHSVHPTNDLAFVPIRELTAL